jgi:hypothetical protein
MPTVTASDRDEIVDLATRLGAWLDERGFDTDDGRALYTEDVAAHSPFGVYRGIEAVMEHLRDDSPHDQRTVHVHSDLAVEVDGDRAAMTGNQTVYFHGAGGELYRTSGLRVAYTLARTPDGWRFATIEISPRWGHVYE